MHSIKVWLIPAAAVLVLVAFLPVDLWGRLIWGWMPFVARVLPRVRFNGATVGFSLAVAAAFTLGTHWLAATCYARRDPATGERLRSWKPKWTLALVAATFLMFAAGTCMIGVAHQTVWLATSPEPQYAPALYFPERDSAEALQDLGYSVSIYADVWKTAPPL